MTSSGSIFFKQGHQAPQSNHNTIITSAIENNTRGVVLAWWWWWWWWWCGGGQISQYSLQIFNLGNDVIQNVIIIYTDILDSLRDSLTQELNQGRPRRNYRAQTRPNEVTFASSPSLRLIPDTGFPPDPLAYGITSR